MVKKYAPGHSYKQQRCASNPHCDSKVFAPYHYDRATFMYILVTALEQEYSHQNPII